MIKSFRHKGLARLFEKDETKGVQQAHIRRLQHVLIRLDAAVTIADMRVPGWDLHRLKGDLQQFWAVSVSGAWRVIFRFEDGDAFDVDYLDYH